MQQSFGLLALIVRRGRPRRPRSTLAMGLTLITSGCALLESKCTYLEAFPEVVQVPVSTAGPVTFEVYARLRKGNGQVLNDAIEWTFGGGLSVSPAYGRLVSVKVDPATAGEHEITVTSKGKTDVVTVKVVHTSGDQVRASGFLVPSVLAVFNNSVGCPPDSTYAFVEVGVLGDRGTSCASATQRVVTFSERRAPQLWTGSWGPGQDEVDARISDLATGPNSLPIKVWRLSNLTLAPTDCALEPTNEDCLLLADLFGTANGVFQTNRVGLMLTWDKSISALLDGAITCHNIQDFIDPYGTGPLNDRWVSNAVNLYLVAQDVSTDSKGKWCWAPTLRRQTNVIRYQRDAVATTLTHELGHMLALHVPWGTPPQEHVGHVDHFAGFAHDNVMFAFADLNSTASRTRLSLGQVYRMQFDRRSWNATGTPVDCACDPYASGCGYLSRDTRVIKKPKKDLDITPDFCPSPP